MSENMACGLAGLSGFMGPHILFVLSKTLEKKLEAFASIDKEGE